jgi:hypothetical protein
MSRISNRVAILTVILSAWTYQAASAQGVARGAQVNQPGRFPGAARLARLFPLKHRTPAQPVRYAAPNTSGASNPAAQAHRVPPGYPNLNAPLYTSPVQNVPYQVGGTLITNQAFAPHEMLYKHTYRAIYPPYYYQVKGSWMISPWGVWSRDTWKLQGTEVKVKYRTRIPLLAGFAAPSRR